MHRSLNAQLNAVTEPWRTDLNAIMTAWQCGGQGVDSPQLHPINQAVLRRGAAVAGRPVRGCGVVER